VTYDEEKKLRKYGDVFRAGKIGLYLKKLNERCIFFNNGKCLVYPERPEACRRYPFYLRESGDERALFVGHGKEFYVYVDIDCEGIGRGEKVERTIERLINRLLVTFSSHVHL
jgi:hypothetical protein